MPPKLFSIFRPVKNPPSNLPFSVRSIGHYRTPPGFRDAVVEKNFTQLFWGIAGAGRIVINGVEYSLGPRQAALYLPGMRHQVYAAQQAWEYCWMTMDGPLAEVTVAAFGLRPAVWRAGPAPLALFRRLQRDVRDPARSGERRALLTAFHILMSAAGRRPEQNDPLVAEAIRRINRQWQVPVFGVKTLAAELRVHRSSLTRRFQAQTGIAPLEYITRLRAQSALSLLQSATLSIAEVAGRCGYNDPNYFSRLIRQVTGMAPRAFRRLHAGVRPQSTGGEDPS